VKDRHDGNAIIETGLQAPDYIFGYYLNMIKGNVFAQCKSDRSRTVRQTNTAAATLPKATPR